MDGLIPFLIHAMKKHNKPHHRSFIRSFSEGSTRSYHLLVGAGGGPDSFSGSSHRRTRSEFQPPAAMITDFSQHSSSSGLDLLRSSSLRKRHANQLDSHITTTAAAAAAGGGSLNMISYGRGDQLRKEKAMAAANSHSVQI